MSMIYHYDYQINS